MLVQAAAIAFATFGLLAYVDGGGTFDKATDEGGVYGGAVGFVVHSVNGQMITPVLALALLVVAYIAKVPGGVRWSAIVFVTVVVQVGLGIAAEAVPTLGWVHGALAVALFAVAVIAARRAEVATPVDASG